jgi:predicted transcriptional regulator
MEDQAHAGLLELTASIVSAHVTGTSMAAEELPGFIKAVYAALRQAPGGETAAVPSNGKRQQPAVPIKQSVFPDHVICLEDGKKMKMLRRHLTVDHGMTVAEYRAKWGLPASYPVVAPNYAAKRSDMARKIGLGRKREVELGVETGAETEGDPDGEPEIQKIAEGVSGKRASRRRKAA